MASVDLTHLSLTDHLRACESIQREIHVEIECRRIDEDFYNEYPPESVKEKEEFATVQTFAEAARDVRSRVIVIKKKYEYGQKSIVDLSKLSQSCQLRIYDSLRREAQLWVEWADRDLEGYSNSSRVYLELRAMRDASQRLYVDCATKYAQGWVKLSQG